MTTPSPRVTGVVVGVVRDRDDPEGEGRLRIEFPWSESTQSAWAPVASAMAGAGRGAFFMPELGDEVLVAFERGEFDHPFVIGFLWNGVDRPPSKDVRQRMIRSNNGHAIRFVDSTPSGGNQGALIIEDAHGNMIVLTNGKISIQAVAVLEIEAPIVTVRGPGWTRTVIPNNNPI